MINQSVEASSETLLHLEEKVMEWISASGIDKTFFTKEEIVLAYNSARAHIQSLKKEGEFSLNENDGSLESFFLYRCAFEDCARNLAKKNHIPKVLAEEMACESSYYGDPNDLLFEDFN